jgi:threonine aldolase
MRQAGYLAAAGIYALENNLNRLVQDHEHAQLIGNALQKKLFIKNLMPVQTNILVFEVAAPYTAASFTDYLASKQVLAFAISATQVRMVTHLDISRDMVNHLVAIIDAM